MTTTAPPPSPSKRPGLLRSVVTSIDRPVDRDTHAQRWHRAPAGPRSPCSPNVAGATGSAGGSTSESSRVRSLVQGWEQASLGTRSRPYEALPPGPTSPYRTHFATRDASSDRPALRVNSNQPDLVPGEATSPTRGTSPTVPASFFQKQAFARTGNEAPVKFDPHQQKHRVTQPGKENCQPSPTAAGAPRLPQISMAPLMSASTMSARTDLTTNSDAQTALTVETMATRSSGSTHASSLVTELVAQPVRQVPATRFGTFSRIAANGPRDEPAPAQSHSRPPFSSHMSSSPPSRPAMNHRPVSSFIEALPPRPSAPIPPPDTARSTSPRHAWDEPSRYSPLPLDRSGSPPLATTTSKGTTPTGPPLATKGRRRPRSSSVGDGVRPTGATLFDAPKATRPAETPAERTSRIEAEFARLLDKMQLPDPTVRSRMLGLALPLKEEMLRTAAVTSPTLNATSRSLHQRGRSMNTLGGSAFLHPSEAVNGIKSDARATSSSASGSGIKSFLRKAKSNSSLRSQNLHDATAVGSATPNSSGGGGGRRARSKSHSRTTSSLSMFRSLGKSSGAGAGTTAADVMGGDTDAAAEGPAFWALRLRTGTIETLRVKELGRLRGRLRNESPIWIDEFVKEGGYIGLLERLKDLLDKEWREEQHDDQVLHELLRCFKALTMTNIGKRTLASYSPTPFLPFAALLFSEKRPGDLPCRQILVELVHALFQICPPACDALPRSAWSETSVSLSLLPPPPDSLATTSSTKASGYESGTGSGGVRRYTRRAKIGDDDDNDNQSASGAKSNHHLEREEILTPERIQQAHRFVVSLMQGPPDEEEEAKVDFVRRAHRERAYKVWVKEIADCVRDYFWVFCHANNLFWTLEQIDAEAVEAPKVPSGMTGGVEYEAMAYCTAHLRLINEVASTCPTQEAAFAFHEQLFLSGFERVLFTLRRASLVYYQSLHLEMSRYISLARSARFNLGPRILACLDRRFLRPEEQMVLLEAERRNHQTRSGAPQLGAVF